RLISRPCRCPLISTGRGKTISFLGPPRMSRAISLLVPSDSYSEPPDISLALSIHLLHNAVAIGWLVTATKRVPYQPRQIIGLNKRKSIAVVGGQTGRTGCRSIQACRKARRAHWETAVINL